ncbi:Purple acid Phosphatase, N-terminal domain [Abditibacterium utsteinense]|uniref:Purple acid Phosphatase, N-terminal domain n=1 Tax=Abditibacterium utsteinense TaxID=1960156 RepID=A0A2S8SR98_9BACT|nr:metallophosphoesterase [Abditibacterium utsteinense]PQV63342.1 Purple acid Phosphatase, N-terminal domain [Abditibacterium utsteinense]
MSDQFTRRQFLRSAGGITFLALSPVARGLFAMPRASKLAPIPPLFTALPYIQPGNNSRLIQNRESMVIAWQTDAREANFRVEYGATKKYEQSSEILRTVRWQESGGNREGRLNYAAMPQGLKLGTRYFYRVSCNGSVIAEGYFTTRMPRGKAIRFVAFGDNSFGGTNDRAIAYHAYQAHPDFVMNTGDNVYEAGLDSEYVRHFFPVYNADAASPRIGAPLLRSVPFYSVLGNHDVSNGPNANFDRNRDALGYYTALHLPLNGPQPVNPTPIVGAEDRLEAFRRCAGERFPRMANYSFDVGDAHFLCLDSNLYLDPTQKTVTDWIEADLRVTDARWKFVTCHHGPFNVGPAHYTEQQMRVLAPIFEKHSVDVALHGHEHSYQRPRPIRFAPRDLSRASILNSGDRLVPGDFSIDTSFDGEKVTKANGVIYIVTGAGGNHLHGPEYTQNPEKWTHQRDNRADYVMQFVADRHSFTAFDLDHNTLRMTQIDEWGREFDRITLTKS